MEEMQKKKEDIEVKMKTQRTLGFSARVIKNSTKYSHLFPFININFHIRPVTCAMIDSKLQIPFPWVKRRQFQNQFISFPPPHEQS